MTERAFTPREMDVMSILWDLGSATVGEVNERIPAPLAYTTVLSLMRTLEQKGYVRHEEEGRAHRYYPTVDWRSAGQGELRRLLSKVFKGSPELLLVQLVSDRSLSEEQLRKVRDMVDSRLGEEPEREEEAEGEMGDEK